MAERVPDRHHAQTPDPFSQEVETTAATGLDFDLASAIEETLAAVGGLTPSELNKELTAQTNPDVADLHNVELGSVDLGSGEQDSTKSAATPATGGSVGPVDGPVASVGSLWSRTITGLGRVGAMRAVPAWLVSLMVHVAILISLAAIQIEPVKEAVGMLLTAVANDEGTSLEEGLQLETPTPESSAPASAETELASGPADFSPAGLILPDTGSLTDAMEISAEVGKIGSLVESIVPGSALTASTSRISSSLSGRSSGSAKSELIERYGGNAASERSVSLALQWLSDHQDRSGGWTFGHSAVCRGKCENDGDTPEAVNAATALALLPFLGAGQTHTEGKYKATVQKGLAFLINRMKVTKGETPRGSWHEDGGSMYSHGLASIVICEAYAMTRDPGLYQPAQLALNYIMYAQDPRGGGWRYSPKQAGDTSVVGWQLMALKSGAMGNLSVTSDTFRLANNFLDSVGVNDGAYYGYDTPTANIEGRQSTTAVGLLSRMYLGWSKEHPGLKEGVAFLAKRGPSVDDLYYSYYATQVMRQYGGAEWENWNRVMRDSLIQAQVAQGHAIGSWYSDKSGHNLKGGRLYCTAMSTMILEVYYRHMPLYSEKSSDEEFEF